MMIQNTIAPMSFTDSGMISVMSNSSPPGIGIGYVHINPLEVHKK